MFVEPLRVHSPVAVLRSAGAAAGTDTVFSSRVPCLFWRRQRGAVHHLQMQYEYIFVLDAAVTKNQKPDS